MNVDIDNGTLGTCRYVCVDKADYYKIASILLISISAILFMNLWKLYSVYIHNYF
jgi:hypothetical protein